MKPAWFAQVDKQSPTHLDEVRDKRCQRCGKQAEFWSKAPHAENKEFWCRIKCKEGIEC